MEQPKNSFDELRERQNQAQVAFVIFLALLMAFAFLTLIFWWIQPMNYFFLVMTVVFAIGFIAALVQTKKYGAAVKDKKSEMDAKELLYGDDLERKIRKSFGTEARIFRVDASMVRDFSCDDPKVYEFKTWALFFFSEKGKAFGLCSKGDFWVHDFTDLVGFEKGGRSVKYSRDSNLRLNLFFHNVDNPQVELFFSDYDFEEVYALFKIFVKPFLKKGKD